MKLSRDDWILEASAAFRSGGVDAVRVEVLARDLGVTKGSFYWHFRDRAELLDALLVRWEEELDWLVDGVREAPTPRDRILRFFELALMSPFPPDKHIFAWARQDREVAGRVDAVERRRIAFLAEQLRSAGLEEAEALSSAEVLYLSTLGWLERRWRSLDVEARMGPLVERATDLVLPGVRR